MAAMKPTMKTIPTEVKIILQRRIHTIYFTDSEEDLRRFRCVQCYQMAIYHITLQCSHLLCDDCFATLHKRQCPAATCSMQVTPCHIKDKLFEGALSQLNVMCENQANGCPEVISLCNLLAHESSCQYSHNSEEKTKDLEICKQQIKDLQRQLVGIQKSIAQLHQTCGYPSPQKDKLLKEAIVEELIKECTKERIKLQENLTEKFQLAIDNQMNAMQNKIQNMLLSKHEKDFQNLEKKMWSQLQENCDVIQESTSTNTIKTLCDEIGRIKSNLETDFSDKTNEIKTFLHETSRAFIQGVLDVKCPEMENRSLNILATHFKRYSETNTQKIKNEITDGLKKNITKQTKHFQTKIENEVQKTCNQQKHAILNEMKKGLTQTYKNQNEELKNDVIKAINYSHLFNDIASISQRIDVLMTPKSSTLMWDVEDFKNKIDDDEIIIESDIFHIPEFGCKIRFKLKLKPDLRIGVEYLEQATNELHPLNGHLRITFTFKDELENNKNNDFIRIFEPSFNNWMADAMIHIPNMTKDQVSYLHSRWLKDGKIQMKVTLEPLVHLVANEPHQHGSLIWKIDRYSDVRDSFRFPYQYLVSESFYSTGKGYRLKGHFSIGQQVHFRLYFLKGPWDNDLPNTFKHRTTVQIISEDDEGQLEDKTFSKETDSVDCDEFGGLISEEELKKYIKNDSLVISFKIESLKGD